MNEADIQEIMTEIYHYGFHRQKAGTIYAATLRKGLPKDVRRTLRESVEREQQDGAEIVRDVEALLRKLANLPPSMDEDCDDC